MKIAAVPQDDHEASQQRDLDRLVQSACKLMISPMEVYCLLHRDWVVGKLQSDDAVAATSRFGGSLC
jgi:hypothetical protein